MFRRLSTRIQKEPGESRFVKASTRGLFEIHGWKNLGLFFHGYYYLSHLDQYVRTLLRGFRALRKVLPVSKMDSFRPLLAYVPHRYHGKVIRLEDAKKIVTLNQSIAVDCDTSKKVVPFEVANQMIVENPGSITVMDCACRREKKNPCTPLSVCMVVGEPYASFALNHAKNLNPRRVSQQEAADILEACHKRGWVSGAFFNWTLGGRFYAICNCCSCCCGARELMPTIRSLKDPIELLAPSGYLAVVDRDRCEACGACVSRCPFDAISMKETYATVNPDLCLGCGVCPSSCPEEAIELIRDSSKGIPLDLHALVPESGPAG